MMLACGEYSIIYIYLYNMPWFCFNDCSTLTTYTYIHAEPMIAWLLPHFDDSKYRVADHPEQNVERTTY